MKKNGKPQTPQADPSAPQKTVQVTDEAGNPLVDDYSFTRYNALGEAIESGIINNSTVVQLRHDEKLIVDFLPQGTKFVVREIASDGFHSSHSINGGTTADSETATGDMSSSVSVVFINSTSALLPSTGGTGPLVFMLPLGIAFLFALSLPLLEKAWKKYRPKA